MKQLVILSGKGGTGKTSIVAALAQQAFESQSLQGTVLADADVDAANLDLVLNPVMIDEHEFIGGGVAVIDPIQCGRCGICEQVCRFDAILPPDDQRLSYQVDPIACEGCAACVYACPDGAIRMEPQVAGSWYQSNSRFGALFHAQLLPGQENSGKLVTMVKQQARLYGLDHHLDLVLVDGPPGIGCPVISALSGADLALIIAEPTVSGVHDMERVLKTADHFRLQSKVIINKADIYPLRTQQIKRYCQENDIEVLGEIPFDKNITQSMVMGEPVTTWKPDAPSSQAIKEIWSAIQSWILDKGGSNGR